MQITIVQGTARIDNKSHHVVQTLHEKFKAAGAEVSLVKAGEHVEKAATVPPWGEGGANDSPTKWKEIAERTDMFVMVLPEYNHGYPGEWKLLMDSLYKEFEGKHVAVVGVSGGNFAGARVMEHVMPVLLEFKMRILPQRLHVGNVKSQFDEEGNLTDEKTEERFDKFVTGLLD